MYLNAKLAYLLCTCHKFNDAFMTAMTKQFEKSKTVATRHYFTFHITLCEPIDGKYKNNFAIKNSHFEFAGSDDIILSEALQLHNNEVLSYEMVQIYENLKKQNISLDIYQIVSVYTIAALIKYYRDAGFKYIFIPIIINYGRNGNFAHQAALIIDFNGSFLFYEPHGKYSKYGKSYSDAVCEFFHIFDDCGLFGETYIPINQCMTYHEFLGVGADDGGIQNILLNRNNARELSFNTEYNQTIDEIKAEFPTYNLEPYYKTVGNENEDHAFRILDLLFNIDKSNIDKKLSKTPYDNEKRKTYERLLNKVLEHYCCYNSQTCVTITLIEMNEFFKYAESSNIKDEISGKITSLYNEFKIPVPNPVLMKKLNNLLDVFNNSEEIREIVTNSNHISETCSKLFK
jgi:hypothetical protein